MLAQIIVVVLASTLALGCRSSESERTSSSTEVAAEIRKVTIPEVAQYIQTKSAVLIDTNGSKIREEFGVIPGAVLLSNHREYPLTELPPKKDAKLVFYCGGLACGASHVAASRAAKAGYTDVNVLPDGIKGWKNAGQPTDTPKS
jgi:rhodanese-related sulfurtransferase